MNVLIFDRYFLVNNFCGWRRPLAASGTCWPLARRATPAPPVLVKLTWLVVDARLFLGGAAGGRRGAELRARGRRQGGSSLASRCHPATLPRPARASPANRINFEFPASVIC